ncbi:MAG TPA: hypothetical protein VFZ21_26015 [Gemmatimonadaceae bacterium]|nr:hypothetical protein [Gemmatimonadaceae bacterium]
MSAPARFIGPEVSNGDLSKALLAASRALPPGPLLIMVLVVSEGENAVTVHSASNVKDERIRAQILKTELGSYTS